METVAREIRSLGGAALALFSRAEHFAGQHEDEVLYRAGPFTVSHLEEELKEHA